MNTRRQKILGCDIDLIKFEEAVQKVKDCLELRQKMHIVTINPEMIELAGKNSELSQILNTADLVIPDGSGIKLALYLKGIKQEKIPGIDFAKRIISECSKAGLPIALIGAKEDTVSKAALELEKEFRDLKINYLKDGYFTAEEESKIIHDISISGSRLILAALGAPKQEFFIKKCIEKYPEAVYIGVGGSFDVWAGEVERAPEFFRKTCLEWLYRTLKQPQRIKRIYKTLPIYLFKIIMEAMKENYRIIKE